MVQVLTSSAYPLRDVPSARRLPPPEALGSLAEPGGQPSTNLSFRDVLDAINPLNHIPVLSDLVADATGHEPSAASKLAGGTLLGGPIGFIASLANVIFEEVTGATPVKTLVAALTGEENSSQEAAMQAAEIAASESPASAPFVLTAVAPNAAPISKDANAAILSLYGASPASAHASYRNAQLRPYLTDVTESRVL